MNSVHYSNPDMVLEMIYPYQKQWEWVGISSIPVEHQREFYFVLEDGTQIVTFMKPSTFQKFQEKFVEDDFPYQIIFKNVTYPHKHAVSDETVVLDTETARTQPTPLLLKYKGTGETYDEADLFYYFNAIIEDIEEPVQD